VYVDSSACNYCSFSSLTKWKHFEKKLEENNTGVLFIIHNSDEELVINSLKSFKFNIHFIFDKDRRFKAKNIKTFHLAQNNTFVMDKDKNVIFIGSPIANEKNWQSFIKLVKH
jgi:hypothetical protein